jgi:hypothetical protein
MDGSQYPQPERPSPNKRHVCSLWQLWWVPVKQHLPEVGGAEVQHCPEDKHWNVCHLHLCDYCLCYVDEVGEQAP